MFVSNAVQFEERCYKTQLSVLTMQIKISGGPAELPPLIIAFSAVSQ